MIGFSLTLLGFWGMMNIVCGAGLLLGVWLAWFWCTSPLVRSGDMEVSPPPFLCSRRVDNSCRVPCVFLVPVGLSTNCNVVASPLHMYSTNNTTPPAFSSSSSVSVYGDQFSRLNFLVFTDDSRAMHINNVQYVD